MRDFPGKFGEGLAKEMNGICKYRGSMLYDYKPGFQFLNTYVGVPALPLLSFAVSQIT